MRKKSFLLLSLLIAFCSSVFADGYTVDFNKKIDTGDHGFAVASNWGHIVGTGNYDNYGPYYMSYSYTADGGFGSTGALCASRQFAGDNWGGTECYDLLVSPVVSGEITLKVKASSSASSSNPSYVEIYKVETTGTTYTYGDLIQRFTVTDGYTDIEGETDWKQISLTLSEEQRIGIRAQYAYLDDFTAANAVIVPEKSITIATAVPSETTGTIRWEQQANGKVLVKYVVTVTNNGEVDLTKGMENYSISIFNRKDNTVYATVPVPQDLAINATSDEFEVSAEVEPNIWPNTYSYINMDLKENLKGSVIKRAQSAYDAYEPKFVFRVAESPSTVSTTNAQNYGLISEETTKAFELCNLGVAPLTIKSITLPAGFTSSNMPTVPTEGLVIAKKTTLPVNITLPVTTLGNFSDNLTIVYLDKEGVEQTYTLAFSGSVLAEGTWAADFNSSTTNIAYPAGSIAEYGIDSDRDYNAGTYNHYLIGRTSASDNKKFITPKLHATAGQKLTFDVKGVSGESYYAKVYVSADRKTWGEPVAYFTTTEKEGAETIGTTWVNKSITFNTEGDYYVAFELFGKFGIDNIIGLTKVDVAHDLYFKSVNWPDASVKSGTSLTKPSLDIIPLTDETANAYTVKYVCGETVLAETAAVEMTASANSSKTFYFTWTPEVEHTTIYTGTKVVFEFTDGTKFETEPFDLTVTHAPIFHFLDSNPTSKWYEPKDRTAPINFGNTNTADTKNFVIYNWGPATLQVKSITLPNGFTTSVEAPFTVASYDESDLTVASKAFDITFSANEAGNYGGNLEITYVNGFGNDSTFTLPISGTKLDPAKFYANFGTESDQWPAGSVYEKNVSTTNAGTYNEPNYCLSSSSDNNNKFITPLLQVTENDSILFDAAARNSYYDGIVKLYLSTDRKNWGEAVGSIELSKTDNQNLATYKHVFTQNGNYYLAFELNNAKVDEIYGLKSVAVEHDWLIASSDVPAEAMQNGAFTASVNILNVGLKEEAADAYTMTVFVDGKPVANGETVALPTTNNLGNAGTKISATFRYPKTGTFPVLIEVKAGDYRVVTDTARVTFTEEVAVAEAIEIGTKAGNGRDYGFVDWYNNDGNATLRYTDIIYPAAKLTAAGMKAGDKINQIAFRSTGSSKSLKAVVTSWVGLSAGEVTLGTPAKDAMTEVSVYNGEVSLSANFESVINITDAPIVWDGTSDIRVYTEAVGQGSGNWVNANYDYDSDIKMSYNGTEKAGPLAYFTLAAEAATLSGTVKDVNNSTVAGATLTLVSNDGDNVQYAGTTNDEGAYSINVIQSNRIYDVTIAAEGYKDTTVTIEMNGASLVKDFVIKVDKSIELNELIAKITELKEQVEVDTLKTAINETLATAKEATADEAIAVAIDTLKTLIDKAEASIIAKDILPKMKELTESTNVYTAEAYETYYNQWQVKYNNGTLVKAEANSLEDPFKLTEWRAANTCDNFLLSAWDTTPDLPEGVTYYINTWSTEGENDGSNFKVPFFEYWTADANALNEKTLTATMNNLEPGTYDVTALVRVRVKNGEENAANGITMQANNGEAVNVTGEKVGTTQFYLNEVTATGVVTNDSTLKIKFIVAADNNISWLSFKNVMFEKKPFVINPDKDELVAPEGYTNLIVNGNLTNDDVTSFVSKEAPSSDIVGARIIAGAGENNSRGIVVKSAERTLTGEKDDNGNDTWSGQDWDTQFWINLSEALPANSKLHVEFDYAANKAAKASTQAHGNPGDYQHYIGIGDVNFTTEWKHFSTDIDVTADMANGQGGKGLKSIAFNLAEEKSATEYYFDNFGVWAQIPEPVKEWKNIIVNSDIEGESMECFYVTEQGVGGPFVAVATEGIGVDGSKAVKVQSADNPTQNWDSQFFIRLPYQLPAGTQYKVSFDYKADKAGDFETQSHANPGQYIHWAMIGSGSFTTDWQTFTAEGTVPTECDGSENKNGDGVVLYQKTFQTIAFNLALNKTATEFIFDNVKFEIPEDVLSTLTLTPDENAVPYPTGIKTVNSENNAEGIYNLNGQKVMKTQKGLYIMNGRKVVMK